MGSTDSKLNFRKAVIQLTTKTQVICVSILLSILFQYSDSSLESITEGMR